MYNSATSFLCNDVSNETQCESIVYRSRRFEKSRGHMQITSREKPKVCAHVRNANNGVKVNRCTDTSRYMYMHEESGYNVYNLATISEKERKIIGN